MKVCRFHAFDTGERKARMGMAEGALAQEVSGDRPSGFVAIGTPECVPPSVPSEVVEAAVETVGRWRNPAARSAQ